MPIQILVLEPCFPERILGPQNPNAAPGLWAPEPWEAVTPCCGRGPQHDQLSRAKCDGLCPGGDFCRPKDRPDGARWW